MDALALLCNLHADGPTSLRRLRRGGVDSLDALARTSSERLAALLGAPPAFARRFAREGRLLAERLLDPEPEEAAPITRNDSPPPPATEHPAAHTAAIPETAAASAAKPSSPLPRTRSAVASATPAPPAEPATRLATHASPGSAFRASDLLRPGLLEGLDRRLCEKLIAQGVRTLSVLVDAAGLPLARRVGLSLPRLLDLAYRAERLLDEGEGTWSDREGERPVQAPAPSSGPAVADVRLRTVEIVPRPAGGGVPTPARPPLSANSAPQETAAPASVSASAAAAPPEPGSHDLEEPDAAGPFA